MWKIYEKEKDNMHTIILVIKIMAAIKMWEALNETIIYEYATEKHLCKYRTQLLHWTE